MQCGTPGSRGCPMIPQTVRLWPPIRNWIGVCRITYLLLSRIGRHLRSLSGDGAQRGSAAPWQSRNHTLTHAHLFTSNGNQHRQYHMNEAASGRCNPTWRRGAARASVLRRAAAIVMCGQCSDQFGLERCLPTDTRGLYCRILLAFPAAKPVPGALICCW